MALPLVLQRPALLLAGGCMRLFVAGLAVTAGCALEAQTMPLSEAAPGLVETGVPAFAVTAPEAMGLSAAPVDLQPLPDGRVLAVGYGELALGDGVRWETFRQAPDDPRINMQGVAVDEQGTIYAGMAGGFGRVAFGADGFWRLVQVARLPQGGGSATDTPVNRGSVGARWLWWWNSGPVISWRPGEAAKVVGQANAPGRTFEVGRHGYLSDSSTGELFRLEDERLERMPRADSAFVEQAITAAVPLDSSRVLVGTVRRGVQSFDGETMSPLVTAGPLAGEFRINDLCATEGGMFAAAVDNVGILFFDAEGRTVQALHRSVDHRLARVKRLVRAPGGLLWALLNDGVARVSFPSRLSSLEPIVVTGLAFAQPYRLNGRLWLLADGRAQRGIYDETGRLARFEIDSPEAYVSSLVEVGGVIVAGARGGIYRYVAGEGWRRDVAGPDSVYVRTPAAGADRWLYIAENEVGWLRCEGETIRAERFPYPTLGHAYGAVADSAGRFWAELGMGRVARVDPTRPAPTVTVFGSDAGLLTGWAQLFLIDDVVRVNVSGQIRRFDEASGRFVPDPEILARVPALREGVAGRPVTDARGRLWVAQQRRVEILRPDGTVEDALPEGVVPTHLTPQPDGVMWLHQQGRLLRYDPLLPAAEEPALRAVITRVYLPTSDTSVFAAASRELGELAAEDNYLIAHFLSPNSPVGELVTFEVKLDGAEGGWVSTGASGQAAFNNLGSGTYVLRVRPRAGERIGEEAQLGFTLLAPWYLTTGAYFGYGLGALGLLVAVGGFVAYMARREQARLEMLVVSRTAELHATNQELERQIGESRERAEALRVSEDRYRRLSENAPDIVFRLRLEPTVAYDYINAAVTRVTGYRPEEFYENNELPRQLAHPVGTESIYDLALARKVPEGVREICWTTRLGRVVTLEERLTPVRDRDGCLIAIEGIARDVTERKRAEQEIRTLSQAIEQSPVGVMITDLDGTVVFANPRMTELTGFSTAELLKQNLRAARTELESQEQIDALWRTIGRGQSWRGELGTPHRDGHTVHLRSTFSPLRGADGIIRNFLVLNEDITQWLHDQERQRRLEQQLFQVQKLESLGTMAGGIAHDFNNILTGILGYAELVAMAVPENPAISDDVRAIQAAGLRAKELVAQILTFSRRSESKLTAIDLAQVVGEACTLVRASTPSTIEIVRDLDPGIVRADPTQIHQVVLNLCTNAVHAMRDKRGRLTIAVARVDVDGKLADEITNLEPGPHVKLVVSDTGQGMDEATLERIFDPFFTTKAAGEGTGLGCAIVQGIVANHHAGLRVESAPGVGTTFEIFFPVVAAEMANPNSDLGPANGTGFHVMVVDDEPAVAKFAAARLQQFDYRVSVFHDSREALAAFLATPDVFHAVVTDLTMPDLTGPQLILEIRHYRAGIPAVITSGLAPDLAAVGQSLPNVAVIPKPYGGRDLARALQDVLGIV